jgi:sterol desaturase/sphingolipid hydroxylase (fatty acid hydroxylase superfamily)
LAVRKRAEIHLDHTRAWLPAAREGKPYTGSNALRLTTWMARCNPERRKCMSLLTLEHGKLAYRADFALYGIAVVLLAAYLLFAEARPQVLQNLAFVMAGLASWTLIEYLLHRFVLHGVQPFRGWHDAHHRRPVALICAPTIMSASLILVLIFLPALELLDLQRACALTLGVVMGYLAYSVTHHAVHHWRSDHTWLMQRKRWHALHHHKDHPGCYGVTTPFWDNVFRTGGQAKTSSDR